MRTSAGQVAFDVGELRRIHPACFALGIVGSIAVGAGLAWEPITVGAAVVAVIVLLLPFIHIELGFYSMALLVGLPEARLPLSDTFSISFSSLVMVSIALSIISRGVVRREAILGFNLRRLWPVWAFMLAHIASLATSMSLPRSVSLILHLWIWILMVLVIMKVVNSRRILRNIFLLMVVEMLAITFIWFYVKSSQILTIQRYVGGIDYLYVHRGDYAFHLSFIVPLAVALIFYDRYWLVRLFNIGAAFCIAFSLIFTWARGAWVGTLFGMSVFMRNWRAWVLALVAVLAIYYWVPETTKMRFRSIWDPTIPTTTRERLLVAATGWILFKSHPITGAGTGCFEVAMAGPRVSTLIPYGLSAHNLYLESLAETGIIGFAALLWLFWFITKNILSMPSKPYGEERLFKFGLLAIWISLLLQYIVGVGLYNSLPWFFIGLVLAANRILTGPEGGAQSGA